MCEETPATTCILGGTGFKDRSSKVIAPLHLAHSVTITLWKQKRQVGNDRCMFHSVDSRGRGSRPCSATHRASRRIQLRRQQRSGCSVARGRWSNPAGCKHHPHTAQGLRHEVVDAMRSAGLTMLHTWGCSVTSNKPFLLHQDNAQIAKLMSTGRPPSDVHVSKF